VLLRPLHLLDQPQLHLRHRSRPLRNNQQLHSSPDRHKHRREWHRVDVQFLRRPATVDRSRHLLAADARFRRRPVGFVVLVAHRREQEAHRQVVAVLAPQARVHVWVVYRRVPLDVALSERAVLVAPVARVPLVVLVVPVAHREVLVAQVARVAVLAVALEVLLVVLVVRAAVVVPVVSAAGQRRSRARVGVKNSMSSSHSHPLRTRRVLRRCQRASSSSSVAARHKSSHQN
jgi:hypothetical protein